MKSLKDFDCKDLYHLGNSNVVVNVLSRKYMGRLIHFDKMNGPIIKGLQKTCWSGIRF
jgi:hypothetical protein